MNHLLTNRDGYGIIALIMEDSIYLTLEETAEILKVNIRHVRLMIRSKKLRAKNIGIGNQRKYFRVLREDVMRIGNGRSK